MSVRIISRLVALAVLPLVVYPSFFGLSVLLDSFIGDMNFIFRLTSGSSLKLLLEILADWRASLPMSYAVVLLVFLPLHVILTWLGSTGIGFRLLFAVIAGSVFSFLLIGPDFWSAVIFSGCAVILAVLVQMCMYLSHTTGTGGVR